MLHVIITAPTAEQLRRLHKFNIDFKERSIHLNPDISQYEVFAIITNEQKKKLESRGYIVEVISDLVETARERLAEVSRTNRFAEVHDMAEFTELAVSGGYMNVDEIETALIKLQALNPDMVSIIELPNKTWENRTSRAIHVHVGGNNLNRPAVMFTGGIHAREWGGSDICINFIANLIHAYNSNIEIKYGNKTFSQQQIKSILDKIDVFVFPDVNPDGKAYSQSHDRLDDPPDKQTMWWRYNRNPKPVPHPQDKPEAFKTGVDLNRNFNFLWHSGIGTEDYNHRSYVQAYKGEKPFSEPESRNVKFLFDTYTNIKCFLDIHSHAGAILMSWGDDDTGYIDADQNFRNPSYDGKRGIFCGGIDDDTQKPVAEFDYREYMHPLDINTLTKYAKRMSDALTAVRGRQYPVRPALGLYATTGSSEDYAFSQRMPNDENRTRIFAYTIEFGSSDRSHLEEAIFFPQYNPVMLNIINDISSAITELCVSASSEDSLSV
jgi:carboxypeptidase T